MGRLLGVSQTEAYRKIYAGEVPSTKVGRMRRVPLRALDKWLVDPFENSGTAA